MHACLWVWVYSELCKAWCRVDTDCLSEDFWGEGQRCVWLGVDERRRGRAEPIYGSSSRALVLVIVTFTDAFLNRRPNHGIHSILPAGNVNSNITGTIMLAEKQTSEWLWQSFRAPAPPTHDAGWPWTALSSATHRFINIVQWWDSISSV